MRAARNVERLISRRLLHGKTGIEVLITSRGRDIHVAGIVG